MPLLYLAQAQNDNWLPLAAIKKYSKIFIYTIYLSLRSGDFLYNV